MDLMSEFTAVRRVGTPLVSVATDNQPETFRLLREINGGCVLRWDIVQGFRAVDAKSQEQLTALLGNVTPAEATDPVLALELLNTKFPESGLVFMFNAHRLVDDMRVATALGNMRDTFKARGSTMVLMGPSLDPPAELLQDIIQLRHPLPNDAELALVVDVVLDDVKRNGAEITEMTDQSRDQIVGALRGLSSFNAEQQTVLSLSRVERKAGDEAPHLAINLQSLWDRKTEAINAVPGLQMEFRKTERDSIRGLGSLMEFFDGLFRDGNDERPQAVLHIDEIDKALAGSGAGDSAGDSSGVTQDQIGQVLQTMEERSWDGLISAGPPGTGKTLVSKTIAGLHTAPYLRLDMGSLKGSLVGESERRIRLALETIDRIGNGRVFVMATCNKLRALPPELKRRFTAGIWYFDLPTIPERNAIWELFGGIYDVSRSDTIDALAWSEGWTGAEIRNVCRTAKRLGIPVDEARRYIVPICKSGAEDLAELRGLASGNFLDASTGGYYDAYKTTMSADEPSKRKLVV